MPMTSHLSATPTPTVAPPTSEILASLSAWRPRAVALMDYLQALESIPRGGQTVSQDGISVDLPDPLQAFPSLRAALQRAQGRHKLYVSGSAKVVSWAVDLQQFSAVFEIASTRIQAIYTEIGERDIPTTAQKEAVLTQLSSIIAGLRRNEVLLQEAGRRYLAAVPLLAEDKASLSAEVGGLAAVAQAFEQMVLNLAIYYSLQTYGKGLSLIIKKVGQVQLNQLAQTLTSLLTIVENCTLAHQAVARLAGELNTALNNFLEVEQSFKKAKEASFVDQIQQARFTIASRQWKSVSADVLQIIAK